MEDHSTIKIETVGNEQWRGFPRYAPRVRSPVRIDRPRPEKVGKNQLRGAWRDQSFRNPLFRLQNALLLILLVPTNSKCAEPEVIDCIVAVVNQQIITLGDVEEEQKYRELGIASELGERDEAARQRQRSFEIIQQLIQQSLIRNQVLSSAGNDVTPEEVLEQLRYLEQKSGGQEQFAEKLRQRHIALDALKTRIGWQIRVLKFLESRFRQFAVILPKEVEEYYQQSFLPELALKSVSEVPSLKETEELIREILIEEKVNQQIDEWLNSLTQSATIEIFE
jgi:peptidyl-prolyl cis-trans isomerase SurA